jgi:hypothetical protein
MECPACEITNSMGCRAAMFTKCSQCQARCSFGYKYCKHCAVNREACACCGERIEEGDAYKAKLKKIIVDLGNKADDDAMYADMLVGVMKFYNDTIGKSRDEILAKCRRE